MTHSTERKDGWIYMTHKPDPSDWDYDYLRRKAMSTEQDPDATSHATDQDWTPEHRVLRTAEGDIVAEGIHTTTAEAEATSLSSQDYQAALLTRGGESRVLSRREEDVQRIERLENQVTRLFIRTGDRTELAELQKQITAQDAIITELRDGHAYLRRVVIGSLPQTDKHTRKNEQA